MMSDDGQQLYADDWMRVSRTKAGKVGSGRVLISFTGIGHRINGFNYQKAEFGRLGESYDQMFIVSDLTRSWANSIDFDRLAEVIDREASGAEIHSIGNSMGGFIALLAPKFLPISRTVAFAPQYSMNPVIVPWETRWPHYRKGIKDWLYPSLDGFWQDETQYYAFIGTVGPDGMQAKLFPERDNLTLTLLPTGHHVAAELKRVGAMHNVIAHCFDGSYSREWFESEYPIHG